MHPRQHLGMGSPADVAMAFANNATGGTLNTVVGSGQGTVDAAGNFSSDPIGSTDTIINGAHATVNGVSDLAGQTVNVGALIFAAKLDPATVLAQGEQAGAAVAAQIGNEAKAAWDASTSATANEARKAAGVVAAIEIAQNGYNPDDPKSTAALIGVIVGACACIPGVGMVISGAISILYGVTLAIGAILQAVGIINPKPTCNTSGNWLASTVLDSYSSNLPPVPKGSFAALIVPALAQNAANAANCHTGTDFKGEAPYLDPMKVLSAIAALWNANSSGPPMTVYIPTLYDGPDVFGVGAGFGGLLPALPAAFQPMPSPVPRYGQPVLSVSGTDAWNLQGVPTASRVLWPVNQPFMLELSGSTFKTATAASATFTKVALISAAIPASIVAGAAVYGVATKTALSVVLKSMWRGAKFWR
jgi:hypothetical protein